MNILSHFVRSVIKERITHYLDLIRRVRGSESILGDKEETLANTTIDTTLARKVYIYTIRGSFLLKTKRTLVEASLIRKDPFLILLLQFISVRQFYRSFRLCWISYFLFLFCFESKCDFCPQFSEVRYHFIIIWLITMSLVGLFVSFSFGWKLQFLFL